MLGHRFLNFPIYQMTQLPDPAQSLTTSMLLPATVILMIRY